MHSDAATKIRRIGFGAVLCLEAFAVTIQCLLDAAAPWGLFSIGIVYAAGGVVWALATINMLRNLARLGTTTCPTSSPTP